MLLMTQLVHTQRTVRKAFPHGINCTPGVNQMNQNEEVTTRGKAPFKSRSEFKGLSKKEVSTLLRSKSCEPKENTCERKYAKTTLFLPNYRPFWTKPRIIPLVSFTLLSNFSFLGASLNAELVFNAKSAA